mgnify:FL=1
MTGVNVHCKEAHIAYQGELGMGATGMEYDDNMAIAYLVLCVNPSHSV